jgi:hypothetical protein
MRQNNQLEWVDEAFRALGHPLRRELLCLLDDSEDDTVELDRVANHLATVRDVTTEEVTIALLHVHLPKLQAVGFIEYDERSGTIRYHNHEFPEKILRSELLPVTA